MYYDDARTIIDGCYYNAAAALMDDAIREALHAELAPCSQLEFLAAYMERHAAKYGDTFTI